MRICRVWKTWASDAHLLVCKTCASLEIYNIIFNILANILNIFSGGVTISWTYSMIGIIYVVHILAYNLYRKNKDYPSILKFNLLGFGLLIKKELAKKIKNYKILQMSTYYSDVARRPWWKGTLSCSIARSCSHVNC